MAAKLQRWFVVSAIVSAVVVISAALWLDQPLSWGLLLGATVSGASAGSILAIAGSGIAITYATSGIFNFASGAVGMFMAFLYWELRVNRELPTILCLVLVVGIAAPALGAALDLVVMRRLRDAPLPQQLVATTGVMLALMGLAGMLWPATQTRAIPPFFRDEGFRVPGGTVITWDRALTIVVAGLVALSLWFLLKHTKTGLRMRAVATQPELAEAYGVSSARASTVSWAVGSTTASIAGILLAPQVPLGVSTLTFLILDALAAVVIGRLRHLPLVFVGGLLVGLLNAYAVTFLDLTGRWSNAQTALPTVVLFVALLLIPTTASMRSSARRRQVSPDPEPASPKSTGVGVLVLFAAMAVAALVLPTVTVSRLTQAMSLAVIMLSLVLLTGWAGETSLAQMTFAGFGAFAMLRFAGESGSLIGLLAAAAVGAAVGLVVALPALRLQGIYLALGSLAVARIAEIMVFPQQGIFSAVEGGGAQFAPLAVGNWRVGSPGENLLLVTGAFGVLAVGLVLFRRSRFGRRTVALRDSPEAYQAIGLNVRLSRVAVYVLSAAIAGFGGALFAVVRNDVASSEFTMLNSLVLLLLLVVGGVASVGGALLGALLGVSLAILSDATQSSWLTGLTLLGPGLAAIGVSREPGGLALSIRLLLTDLLPGRGPARSGNRRMESQLGELGLTRDFRPEDIAMIDDVLALPEGFRVERAGG